MARGNFDPEIKQAMQSKKEPPPDSPAEMAQDKARGIKPNSPEDQKLDAMEARRQQGKQPPIPPQHNPPGAQPHVPPDAHHVAAAASIAHAILGSRGLS